MHYQYMAYNGEDWDFITEDEFKRIRKEEPSRRFNRENGFIYEAVSQKAYRESENEHKRRKYARRKNEEWEREQLSLDALNTDVASPACFETVTETQEELQMLFAALDKLTPRQKDAFVKAVLKQQPTEQIAREMKISASTVYVLVNQARKALAELVQHDKA